MTELVKFCWTLVVFGLLQLSSGEYSCNYDNIATPLYNYIPLFLINYNLYKLVADLMNVYTENSLRSNSIVHNYTARWYERALV